MKGKKEKFLGRNSKGREITERFLRNKVAMAGMIAFLLLLFIAVFADVFFDFEQQVVRQDIMNGLAAPSREHWLGTDAFGRDLLARLAFGARTSLLIGVGAVLISVGGGGLIGAIAGYFGGIVDTVIMRVLDVLMAIPGTILAVSIVASFGAGMPNLIAALGITGLPRLARLFRISVSSIRNQEFIEASKSDGAVDARIIIEDILPNIIGPIVVQATLMIAQNILSAASMSFLGLGVQPPNPEWGSMMSDARRFMGTHFEQILYPGLCVIFTCLSFNLMGDGLRDALDPRLKD